MPTNRKEVRMLNGYRVIYRPEYPRSMTNDNWKGYVYEHILVAEESLGRPLTYNEVTHHLDGDRSNNKSENILVLLRSQHIKLHMWLDKGASFLKENECNGMNSGKSKAVCYCKECGKTLQLKQKAYCSRECYNESKKSKKCLNKEQLEEDLKFLSFLAIGRKYKVSDNSVRKWAKKYKLL